jgi:hypothetical protein
MNFFTTASPVFLLSLVLFDRIFMRSD